MPLNDKRDTDEHNLQDRLRKLISEHLYSALFISGAIIHSFFWMTAWFSPLIFLTFQAIAVWKFGLVKPFVKIFDISLRHPDIGSKILAVGFPFIILNWIAIFSCFFMLGTITENGTPIEGMWKHFYFSAMTFTTVGYGNLVPSDTFSEFFATVAALAGVVVLALGVGFAVAVGLKAFEHTKDDL